MLDRGANPNFSFLKRDGIDGGIISSGFTPLGYAIEKKNLAIAKLLLKRGCDVEGRFKDQVDGSSIADIGIVVIKGITPLGYAIEMGDFEMVQLLLTTGKADVENKFQEKLARESPLEFALSIHRFAIADLLIRHGASVTAIRELDLSPSSVSAVPPVLGKLSNLKSVKFNESILATVPVAIRKKGEKEILHFFRDLLTDDQMPYKAAKVMVLGKEGVGKTHISMRLRGKSYKRNMSTDGIDINVFKFHQMDLTWYDFGGQEVYYPTHQFFLTPQCLYLIVFNLDDPDYKGRVLYWLRTIANYTQDPSRPSKVVVVGTHVDKVTEAKVNQIWTDLEPMFAANGHVVANVAVSCVEGTGFDVLEESIIRAVELGRLDTMVVPRSFKSIEMWLTDPSTRKSSPKLSFTETLKVFKSLKERQVRQALEFLHDMGVCLFFERLDWLITDPQWLANTFSTLITFSHNWIKEGQVAEKDLVHVWKNSTPEEINQMMQVFRSFEVAFPRKSEGMWIIPSMLRPARNSSCAAEKPFLNCYKRMYRMDILPLGIFGRLVARLQEWNDSGTALVVDLWLNGIVLETPNQLAEITVELTGPHQTLVLFCVVKEGKSEAAARREVLLIQRLAEECNSMFEAAFPSRNGLERPYKQFVVCHHCLVGKKATPTLLPFQECVEMVVKNTSHFDCNGEKVPVSCVGDDVTFGYVRVFSEAEVTMADKPFASGGFGDIYLCKIPGQDKAVAKELRTGNFTQGFSEFQHETSLMSRLRHPNIVELYGIMLNPLRMVIEYCGEGDLLHCIQAGKIVGPELRRKLALDISKGMAFLHSQNPPLAHRDLRSPNILIKSLNATDAVCAKVSDFGLTLSMTERSHDPLSSWQWMAPEAQMGDNYTEKCDLYSFGIVLWEIYSGKFPFSEYSDMKEMQLFRKLREEDLRPTPPSDAPKHVQSLMRWLWQAIPAKRPTFAQCIATLEEGKISKGSISHDVIGRDVRKEVQLCRVLPVEEALPGPLSMHVVGDTIWIGFRGGDVMSFDLGTMKMLRRDYHLHADHVIGVYGSAHSAYVYAVSKDLVLKTPVFTMSVPSSLQDEVDMKSSSSKVRKSSAPTSPRVKTKGTSLKKAVGTTFPVDLKGQITVVSSLCRNGMLLGDSKGKVVVVDIISGNTLCSYQMENEIRNPISSCSGPLASENICWIGAGSDLFRATAVPASGKAIVEVLHRKAHERPIGSIVHVGLEVWTSAVGGNYINIWDAKTAVKKEKIDLPKSTSRIHCMRLVNVRGEPTVWLGGDDEIIVYDVKKHTPLLSLTTPKDGDVLCLAQVGVNRVLAGVRHKDDSGSLLEFNLN